jgi:CheY-like chemotaxis protein
MAIPDDDAARPILGRLSLRAKAIAISTEFTHGHLTPAELRMVLQEFAPSPDEQSQIVRAVEEDLRSARYPADDLARFVAALCVPAEEMCLPPGAPAQTTGGAARDANVLITRKVRSPSLMPFEKIEFRAESGGGEPPPGSVPATPPLGDTSSVAKGRMRFAAGGEAASFTPNALKGLARTRAPRPEGGRMAVLVADDDARSRMMYRAKLEENRYAVTEAKDGIEAWNCIRSGAVQCAVMDMKMPGYHGLEVLGRMVDSNLILPVVIVSAFDQLANEFVVATYPKLTFLTKPASPEQVAAAVNGHLRAGAST